jgi:hypothetical protein
MLRSSYDTVIEKKEGRIGWTRIIHGRRKAYKILVGKPKGMISLGRCSRGWENNIKMDLIETGYEGMDWIQLAQHRVVGSCEHGNAHSASINSGKFLDYLRDYYVLKRTAELVNAENCH